MTVIADVIAVSDDCVAVIGGSRTEVGNFPLRCEKHSENSKKKAARSGDLRNDNKAFHNISSSSITCKYSPRSEQKHFVCSIITSKLVFHFSLSLSRSLSVLLV